MQTTINPEKQISDNEVIFKYMDFISFYALLINQTLFFKRLDMFSDLNEGSLSSEVIGKIKFRRSQFDYTPSEEAEKYAKNFAEKVLSFKPYTLCNSWTIDNEDNYAMWKIYLKGYAEGLAIKTTVGRLKEALKSNSIKGLHFGKVSYNPDNIYPLNVFEVATTKAPAYSYEKEYRAFLVQQSKQVILDPENNSKTSTVAKYEYGCEIKVNLSILLNEIYISPFANKWFSDLFYQTINQYLPTFSIEKIKNSTIKDS